MSIDLSKIKKAIQNGDSLTAIKGLVAIDFSDENWNNQIIAFSARYNEVYKKYNANHIPFAEYTMESSKITNGLLLLISEIENKDTTPEKTASNTLDENTIKNTIEIKRGARNDFKKYGFLCIIIGVIVVCLGFIPNLISNSDLSKILNFGGLIIVLISTYPFHLMVTEKKDMDNLRQLINILALDYEEAFKTFNKICFKK